MNEPKLPDEPRELPAVTLVLDLIGRTVTLNDNDARLLLAGAEAASGSSIGARDLATRLKDLAAQPPQARRRLVFSRPEAQALRRMIQAQLEPGDRLVDLRQALTEL
jgi:hypothetical protein